MLGQSNAFFTKTAFWLWVGNALYHSIVRISSPVYPMDDIHHLVQVAFGFSIILFWGGLKQSSGYDSGHWFWGTMLYLAVLLTVLGKAALVSECVHGHRTAATTTHAPCIAVFGRSILLQVRPTFPSREA
jgi:phospholipid-transporting ATPase